MKRILMSGVVMLVFCLAFGGVIKADDIHLCNVATGCSSNTVIPISGTKAYVTGNISAGDSVWIAIMVPTTGGGGSPNFVSGTLFTALNEPFIGSYVFDHNFASSVDQEHIGAGITATGFTVFDVPICTDTLGGTCTFGVNTPLQITLPNEPAGTMFVAFLEDSNHNIIADSPWSSSLINVPVNVPEPPSLVLLGVGLLGFVGLAGRKLITA